jgi:hypothetical protein
MSQIDCLRGYENYFYNNVSLVGECYKNCPIECVRVKYDFTLSFSSYPTLWYSQVLTNNSQFNKLINTYFKDLNVSFINYTGNFVELKDSIALVNVFYEDLRYSQFDDNAAITFVSLLGTLGGNLGLFLGKYLLSLF